MISRSEKRKKDLLFVNKKKQNNFASRGLWRERCPKRAKRSKSFFGSFFSKKELLSSGFTLIEMIVVIAVLGLVLAVLTTYSPPRSHWLETVAAADRVAAAMRSAQTEAIASGQPVAWRLPDLPAWMHPAVTAPSGGVVFEPDGSATGGVVMLSTGNRQVTVTADWLTGRITVDAPQ
jgi:general secretion pathway protein H